MTRVLPSLVACPLKHFCISSAQVYEVAADVCTRAGDYPEALKALQQLVHLIYPVLAAQEAALAAAEAAAAAAAAPAGRAEEPEGPGALLLSSTAAAGPLASGSSSSSGSGSSSSGGRAPAASPTWDGDSDAAEEDWAALASGVEALDDAAVTAALQRRRFRRWPEAAGALAVYFSCVQGPREGRLDTLATLRRLPRPLLATAEVQAALALAGALAAGDYVRLFRLRAAAPMLVRQVAGTAARAARERALTVMATAYRNIAAAAVCRAVALSMPGLLECLKALADRWVLAGRERVWVLAGGCLTVWRVVEAVAKGLPSAWCMAAAALMQHGIAQLSKAAQAVAGTTWVQGPCRRTTRAGRPADGGPAGSRRPGVQRMRCCVAGTPVVCNTAMRGQRRGQCGGGAWVAAAHGRRRRYESCRQCSIFPLFLPLCV